MYFGSDEKFYKIAGILMIILLTGSIFALQNNTSNRENKIDDWKQIQLENVRTGEKFNINDLEKPVLVETFAVWCPTCTRQQKELKAFHKTSNVTSVSLNVDPNEDKSKVRKHIKQHGFNWRYAVAPSKMTKLLIEEYDNSLVHPPSAPAVLVCKNSTRKLQNGVKPASKFKKEIQQGC